MAGVTPKAPSDPPRQYVELSSGRAAYTDVGEGPAVVAIHGLPGTVRDYRWLGAALEPQIRFVRLDMPGFGETPLSTAPSPSIEGRADYAIAVIEALGLDRPVLIGHSMGGVVVTDVAARRPDLLSGLGLLASVGHRPHRMIRGVPRRSISALLKIPGAPSLFRGPLERGMESGGFRGYDHAQHVHCMHCLAAVDFAAHERNLARLRLPTFLAWTEDDPFIEKEIFQEMYWRVPSGPRVAFPAGGHNLQKSKAIELADSLCAWVSAL